MSSSARTAGPRRPWTLVGALQAGARHTPERRARQLSGLPARPGRRRHWAVRLLTDPWTWITVVLLALYAVALYAVYRQLSPDQEFGEMVVPGLDWQTLKHCARLAAPTALVWSCAFMLLDRLRPLRPRLWLLAFGWGSCVAIWVSLQVNSWAASMMNVSASPGDPAAQARPAVFAAPFVEEASKATILFLLAILVRRRIVSLLQSVALAGLSAIGFAFTENIVYYARAIVYGSITASTGDVDSAVSQLVFLRGVITSYGHPMFTMFSGIGILLGLRTRSKLVRILAPLTGYLAAAFGHMLFNGSSVSGSPSQRMMVIQFVLVVGFMLSFLVRHNFKELKRVRTRLEDYVRMGWLLPRDPENFGVGRRRWWLGIVALSRGPRTWWRTVHLMRAMTELAYTRDAMVRGIVDEAGREYEKELLAEIRQLRNVALDEARGLKLAINWGALALWRRLPRRRQQQAAVGAGWPAPRA